MEQLKRQTCDLFAVRILVPVLFSLFSISSVLRAAQQTSPPEFQLGATQQEIATHFGAALRFFVPKLPQKYIKAQELAAAKSKTDRILPLYDRETGVAHYEISLYFDPEQSNVLSEIRFQPTASIRATQMLLDVVEARKLCAVECVVLGIPGSWARLVLYPVSPSKAQIEIARRLRLRSNLGTDSTVMLSITMQNRELGNETPSLQWLDQPVTQLALFVLSPSFCRKEEDGVGVGTWTPTRGTTGLPPHQGFNSDFDFRKTTWGMSFAEVMAKETARLKSLEPVGGRDLMSYTPVKVGELTGELIYIFANKKLVRAKYIFEDEHSNRNFYIRDFANIDTVLNEKYGNAKNSSILWENETFKNSPENYGLAISHGDLQYVTEWDGPRTTIIHILQGENYRVRHELEYGSVELKSLEKQIAQQKSKDAL